MTVAAPRTPLRDSPPLRSIAAESLLAVRDLRKRYGALEAVRGVSFDVARGECFGLLGPNGAGKTTTLRCCLGLIGYDSGSVQLAGLPVPQAAREARYRIGVVPQFDNLDPDFTVTENLLVFGRYFGLSKAHVLGRIPWLLEFAGLADKGDATIESLSGGMKRRLTLARALVNDPDVLFLDEPTTGLDPQARHVIWQRLRTLLTAGKTIVLTTHFMDEAERLCQHIGIMDRGEIIARDTPRGLIESRIESHVVEVFGEGVEQWVESVGRHLATRIEQTGETAFCYCDDPAPLLESLDSQPLLRALRRAANLEDVFIKLTGRDIRD